MKKLLEDIAFATAVVFVFSPFIAMVIIFSVLGFMVYEDAGFLALMGYCIALFLLHNFIYHFVGD